MVPTKNMRIEMEGVPGEFVRNKNIMGDPTKSARGYSTRSFTLSLTPEYAQALEEKGFPIKHSQNAPEDARPYLAIVLFPEQKFSYPPTVVVSDNGRTRKILPPDKWVEFDESPIEYVDLELLTYENKNGNICVKCEALYFHTKLSLIRNKYPDAFDEEFEPAPFQ